MSEREIQRRFNRGEVVFTDGKFVFMRGPHMGYQDKPWHYTDPLVMLFNRDDPTYELMEFCDCRWWTAEHGQQLVQALASVGIHLKPKAVELLQWRQERRAQR